MIYSKIAIPLLLMIAYIAGVSGDEFDSLFGDNDNIFVSDDEDAIANARKRKTPKPTPRRKPPKPTRAPKPTPKPRRRPTRKPTRNPTRRPTRKPTRKPTRRPTRRRRRRDPTSTPSVTPSMSPTVEICKLPERVKPRRESACSNARNEGYEKAVKLFNKTSCDCYEIGKFSERATEKLLEGEYEEDSDDNARDAAVKECSRDGVERYITDATEACIGPSTCADIGFLVTDLIILEFCELPGTFRYSNVLLEECEEIANETCEGDLFMALIDFLKDGYDCPAKDQFGNAAEAKEFMKEELSKQCRTRVENMLFG